MISHDMKIVLTIISLIASTVGLLIAALFLGPLAIICSLIVLYARGGELKLEMRYYLMASIGLYLGILDFVVATLVLTGILSF